MIGNVRVGSYTHKHYSLHAMTNDVIDSFTYRWCSKAKYTRSGVKSDIIMFFFSFFSFDFPHIKSIHNRRPNFSQYFDIVRLSLLQRTFFLRIFTQKKKKKSHFIFIQFYLIIWEFLFAFFFILILFSGIEKKWFDFSVRKFFRLVFLRCDEDIVCLCLNNRFSVRIKKKEEKNTKIWTNNKVKIVVYWLSTFVSHYVKWAKTFGCSEIFVIWFSCNILEHWSMTLSLCHWQLLFQTASSLSRLSFAHWKERKCNCKNSVYCRSNRDFSTFHFDWFTPQNFLRINLPQNKIMKCAKLRDDFLRPFLQILPKIDMWAMTHKSMHISYQIIVFSCQFQCECLILTLHNIFLFVLLELIYRVLFGVKVKLSITNFNVGDFLWVQIV